MYTRNNVDLTNSLNEALSWSLLKKSVSGEDLTKLETSTTSGISSGFSSVGSDELEFLSNVQTFTSNTKHFNTSLVTPNDLQKSNK